MTGYVLRVENFQNIEYCNLTKTIEGWINQSPHPPCLLYRGKSVSLHVRLRVKLRDAFTRGGGDTAIHYLYGYVPPNGDVILKLLI